MSDWRQELAHLATNSENKFDALKSQLSERLGWQDPLMIQPYIGYGNKTDFYLRGRVLEDEGITAANDNDTIWRNLLNIYRRLESDEVAGATIRATLVGTEPPLTIEVTTDDDGYFLCHFHTDTPIETATWLNVKLQLLTAPNHTLDKPVTAMGVIYCAHTQAQYGVISDIDDTVLQSDVSNYLRAAQQLFLKNALSRLPFPGVPNFYQALSQGTLTQPQARNPIFYVSSSPWNVYTLLIEFFQIQEIPLGPLFLKDYGISEKQLFTSGHHNHKLEQIQTILDTYPHLEFVLMGDSSQQDPEIYQKVALTHPRRIKAIYIRDVSNDKRDQEIKGIARGISTAGIPMQYVENSYTAAQHAASIGLIQEDALPAIEATTDA